MHFIGSVLLKPFTFLKHFPSNYEKLHIEKNSLLSFLPFARYVHLLLEIRLAPFAAIQGFQCFSRVFFSFFSRCFRGFLAGCELDGNLTSDQRGFNRGTPPRSYGGFQLNTGGGVWGDQRGAWLGRWCQGR